MRRELVGLLGLSFAVGCSSRYEPARSPRIVTVMDAGTPTFVKDGEHIGAVGFGGGLADAVRGNPRAEHEARVGHNLVVGGFILDIAGLGTLVGAEAALAQQRSTDRTSNVPVVLAIGGAAAIITGSILLIAGQPHIYDAVNLYNDGIDPQLRYAPPPMVLVPAPPFAPNAPPIAPTAPAPGAPAPAPAPVTRPPAPSAPGPAPVSPPLPPPPPPPHG